MNSKSLLKQAVSAQRRFVKAKVAMEATQGEREKLLEKALVHANSVSELMQIYHLTNDQRGLRITAWTKSIFLLGATPAAFQDYLLISGTGRHLTQKEAEVAAHLDIKRALILVDLTAEQLYLLYSQGSDINQRWAEKCLEGLINNCENLEQLDEWRVIFENKPRCQSSGNSSRSLWERVAWNYKRTAERLST